MTQRIVLFLYQCTMYVAHLLDAPSDVEWAVGHPMWMCNWLPRELLRRAIGTYLGWLARRQAQKAAFRLCYRPAFDKYFRSHEEKFQFAANQSRRAANGLPEPCCDGDGFIPAEDVE